MNNFAKRMIMTLAGVGLCSFSVALFKLSNFGVDPFQCFANGCYEFSGISLTYGIFYTILNLLMLLAVFLVDKHYINIATFINIFLTGNIIDFAIWGLEKVDFIANPTVVTRVILLLAGIVLMCFASALYYTADLGVSTYDAVALIMADKKIAKFQYCRIGADLVCVVLGIVLYYFSGSAGVIAGIGTIVTAFFMGPLIEFFNVHCARPMLYGKAHFNTKIVQ